MVRIPGFHPGDPGSSPGVGTPEGYPLSVKFDLNNYEFINKQTKEKWQSNIKMSQIISDRFSTMAQCSLMGLQCQS